jgi:hypothetical protein
MERKYKKLPSMPIVSVSYFSRTIETEISPTLLSIYALKSVNICFVSIYALKSSKDIYLHIQKRPGMK